MKFDYWVLLLLSATAWLACCGRPADRSVPVQLSSKDADKRIELAVGQELSISLSSNPTTGFSWSFRCEPEGILKILGEPQYKPDRSEPGIVGSGGTETFRFRGLLLGTATLQYEYRRSWEEGIPPARSLVFTVRVAR